MVDAKDIQKLADLARIHVTPHECEKLKHEFDAILDYVGQLDEITAGSVGEKTVGSRYNVFREDVDAHDSGIYTKGLLDAAPKKEGDSIRVKKIL